VIEAFALRHNSGAAQFTRPSGLEIRNKIPHVRLQPPLQESDPMSGFDDRKKAQENKFAHDEELRFRATARRNKLAGLWAAEKMGLSGEAAEAYAKEVVKADFEEAGDEDVFRKLRKDLGAKAVDVSDHQIRREMEDLMKVAMEQVRSGS